MLVTFIVGNIVSSLLLQMPFERLFGKPKPKCFFLLHHLNPISPSFILNNIEQISKQLSLLGT